jgi:hypothetical protein
MDDLGLLDGDVINSNNHITTGESVNEGWFLEEEADDIVLDDVLPPDSSILDDNGHGTCTDEERMALQLLVLMRKIKAPHYAYRAIVTLIEEIVVNKIKTVSPCFRSRNNAIQYFAGRFNLAPLRPVAKLVQFGKTNMRLSFIIATPWQCRF